MKYKTFLPVFPGFYGTIFEPNEESEIDYINEVRKDAGLERVDDYSIEFDHSGYEREMSRSCCLFIYDFLDHLGMVNSIRMENIVSPREYNFHNDSINIEVELSAKNRKAIQYYVYSRKDAFEKFLKDRYTPCSGFIPYYSCWFEDWEVETGSFYSFKNPEHYLGAVLEFICQQEDITDEIMFYACDSVRLECEDFDYETTKVKCEECGEWYSLQREYGKQVEKQTAQLGRKFTPIAFEVWARKNKDYKHCEK